MEGRGIKYGAEIEMWVYPVTNPRYKQDWTLTGPMMKDPDTRRRLTIFFKEISAKEAFGGIMLQSWILSNR